MDDMYWIQYETKCRSEVSEISFNLNGHTEVITAASHIDYICRLAAYHQMTVKEYMENKYMSEVELRQDNPILTGIRIKTRGEELEKMASKILKKPFAKYGTMNRNLDSFNGKKENESTAHQKIKNEAIRVLEENGMEAFSEVTMFNQATQEYYLSMLNRKRREPGHVIRQSYENQKFGDMFIADVAGWLRDSGIDYPLVTVEIMVSSDVRKEIVNLSDYRYPTAYRMIIDGIGNLHGKLNCIPIYNLSQFQAEFITYASKLRELSKETKDIWKLMNLTKEC